MVGARLGEAGGREDSGHLGPRRIYWMSEPSEAQGTGLGLALGCRASRTAFPFRVARLAGELSSWAQRG